MADTHGFQVVIQASEAVVRKALRGAWKSAECPVDPGESGRIPEFLDIETPLFIGSYEVEDGQVQIPQEDLDATLAPDINGVELEFGMQVQVQIKDPPVPSAQLFDMPVEVRARVPVGTLPDSQDVGILLDGLPRANVTADLTAGHPLTPILDTLLDEFVHLAYENGGQMPPVVPFIPHVVIEENVSFTLVIEIARLDTHTELFDDEVDPAYRINVSRPDPNTILISIPIYLRMYNIASIISLDDPMGIETRLNISAPFESPDGLYRAKLSEATVTVDPIQPASATVAGSSLEGDNYVANKAAIADLPLAPDLDALVSAELRTRGEKLAREDIGDFEIPVPTEAEIETAIGDVFHEELESRDFLALWTPSATDDEFEVDDVAVEVTAGALIIALNSGAGADVTAITGFIPADREFAIALDAATVEGQIDQAIEENGFDDLPKRFEEDGEDVDLNSLSVFLVDGAIRMEGEVTVIDAILGSIDVDADFRVDIGLHWVPNAAQNSDGFQELDHRILGEPDVDPEESVLFWVIAIILAVISFGAGSILIGILIIVVALIIQSIAENIGSQMLVDGVTGAVDGIQAWPPDLARIGRVVAVFHDNVTPDPDGVLIDTSGLLLEGTMEVISSCETTAVAAANSGSSYTATAASAVLLQAAETHAAASYRWRAGDGSAEVLLQDKLHTYFASGIYVAKHALTINQPGGATSRHFALVDVRNVPPVVDAGPDITVDEGEVVTLVGHFYDVEPSDTHESIWIFGDHQAPKPGTIVETNDPPRAEGTSTVQHAWCDNGEYVVLLRVRDNNGGVGTDTRRVTVLNVPPVVEAGPDLYAYRCTVITLTGRFEDPGWCDTHTGSWNFGDCTPDHTAIVNETNDPPAARGVVIASHVYERCGTYHAVCTVVDDDGGVGSDYTVIRVVDVMNAGFEDGFRPLRAGDVGNAWYPYHTGGTTSTAAGVATSGIRFTCEQCGVHGGQRAQAIRLQTPARAGILQSVGANPEWAYQISVWCHVEGAGTARLGVDPDGGTDPGSPSVAWSETTSSVDWAQLVQRVVATGEAITIFLEGHNLPPDDDSAPAREAGIRFDDVALVPIQPFCPETPPEEVPTRQCVDFTDLKPGTELPAVYEKLGFTFIALDQQPLRIVAYGPPGGESKLALRSRGILVKLPFVANRVRVELGVNTSSPVVVLALGSTGQQVGVATAPAGQDLQVVEIAAADILRVQISARSGEDTLFRICAWEAQPGPSRRRESRAEGPTRLRRATGRRALTSGTVTPAPLLPERAEDD